MLNMPQEGTVGKKKQFMKSLEFKSIGRGEQGRMPVLLKPGPVSRRFTPACLTNMSVFSTSLRSQTLDFEFQLFNFLVT